MNTDGIAGHIHLAAQFPLRRIGHERLIAGIVQRKHPTFEITLTGSLCSSLAGRFGQSVELSLIGQVQRIGLLLLQQVLRELQTQHRGLLRQLAQTGLSLSVEQRTATHKAVVAIIQQHLLLRRQTAVVTMHVLDALKQPLVQPYVVGVLRQDGRHLLCQRIHLVVGLRTQQVEEHARRTRQQVVVVVLLVVH